jgi:Putative MetA-pathway of phenol degradation
MQIQRDVTGASGSGDHIGPFESRVIGVGPQVGYIFPPGNYQRYLNLKGYGEFDAHDRPSGYLAWLTLTTPCPLCRMATSRPPGPGDRVSSQALRITLPVPRGFQNAFGQQGAGDVGLAGRQAGPRFSQNALQHRYRLGVKECVPRDFHSLSPISPKFARARDTGIQ